MGQWFPAIALAWGCFGTLVASAADTVLVRAEHVILGDGRTLSPGAVLVREGKIFIVADTIEAPEARVVNARWIMPGLVNAATSLGISGEDSEISAEVAPDFETAASIDLTSRDFREALDEGITTAHVIPGTQSVFAGTSSILKTAGGPPSSIDAPVPYLLTDRHGLVVALCSDPASRNQARSRPDTIFMRQPTNRMGVMWILRSTLHKVQQNAPVASLTPESQAILRSALDKQLPWYSVSRTEVDIRSNFELQREFGVQPIMIGGDESYRVMDLLREHRPTVIFTAMITRADARSLRGSENTERRWNVAGQLANAGVPFCLAGDGLLDQMRFAVRFGLDRERAIQAVTSVPAATLQLQNRVGTLEVGRDADLVAFSDDPLEFTSSVEWVMVDGHLPNSDSSTP
jgi:hypothetical protein